MNRLSFIIVLLATYITSVYSQNWRITPNNNQYYYIDYTLKNDSNKLGQVVLIFTVTDGYKSTFINPKFSWSDGSGTLISKMIMPGKYQINLNIVYKKVNSNTIAISELNGPRIIDVEISTLNRHLIKIEYLSDLTVKNIVKRISTFNPLESQYDELIRFVYDYNLILRKYDPYCDLVLPEIITDDFSGKITKTLDNSWKKTNVSTFYSLCNELHKVLKNDPAQNVDQDLVNCLSQAKSIKLNYYNAYRINYLIELLQNSLALAAKHSREIDQQILQSINAIKSENIDSTDRYLIVASVNRKGFQVNNLSVAYTPALFQSLESKQSQWGYFNCPSSPSFCVFPNSDYYLWVENRNKQKLTSGKILNPADSKFKEIVLPVNSSLAIVRLEQNFGKNLNIDNLEFDTDINNLIKKHKSLFLSNISIPIN
jgi:hypothetical protein